MNQIQSLEQLGLTENEIDIYRFLLRNEVSSGTDIYLSLSMDKSSTYRALKKLQDIGLVTVTGEKRNQLFGALESKTLIWISIRMKRVN
ncbi:MAG: helix-turn-helix domain-containing protein [Candidatus Dojkabacteria bacterium]|nr:helix-turn-helix domain-containing protein [Candidatus Dojkabacteria bacterium]MDQ7021829.1 helix-turn-helix domain-containing protein [Candidatus Dojkabacteria bacterium]